MPDDAAGCGEGVKTMRGIWKRPDLVFPQPECILSIQGKNTASWVTAALR